MAGSDHRAARAKVSLRPQPPNAEGVLALDDTIAALVELDADGLCLQWRNHLGGDAVVSAGKEEQARAIGAEAVVTRGRNDFVGAVREALGDQPLDVVADVVGGPLFNDLLLLLRPEGRYATAGAIGGPLVQLDLRTVYLKHLELHGSSQGSRAAFHRLVRYIEDRKVQPLLAETYKLSELHRAQRDFVGKSFFGKLAVIRNSSKCVGSGAP